MGLVILVWFVAVRLSPSKRINLDGAVAPDDVVGKLKARQAG